MTTISQTTSAIERLRAETAGEVIAPGNAKYDRARQVFLPQVDRRPAAIVQPENADEVAAVVTLARDEGLELAVRSGGHSASGHGTTDGGIVLDLSHLRALEIDNDGRAATAETGLTAGELTAAAQAHGLAIGLGDTASVGIGGLTLGGGIGYLVRKHGLTIDDLLGAEVVTADGRMLHVDAEHEPDLFWAIRGGGGNFGVVTRFRYRLHPVGTVTGGLLVLPATADVVAGFIAAAEAAAEELSTIANVMTAPPLPFLPEEWHGKLVVLGMLVHAGPLEDGERAVAPFRALATPLADMIRPMPYSGIYPPEDPDYRPRAAARTLFVDEIDETVAQEILDRLEGSTAMFRAAQLRVLGGAMARVSSDATAFAHRQSKIMVNVAAIYGNPDEAPVHEAWASEAAAALRQSDTGAYVNFVGDEGEERVHAAYPGSTWERLQAVKRRYDPDNLFRLNQNISPAAA
jgi:FAD/FMN-containing dehydrogenase